MEKTIFDNKPGLKRLVEQFYTFGQIDQRIGRLKFDECCAMLIRNNFAGYHLLKESFEVQIWGTPEKIAPDWDGDVKFRPVKHIEGDEGCFEKSLDEMETFWYSVYLHSPSKGWQCIADFWDEESAKVFVEILKSYKKPEKESETVTAYVAKVWFGAHPGETKDTIYANLNDIWMANITEDVEEIQAVRVYEQTTHRLGVDQLQNDDVFFIVGLEGRYKKVD